MQPVNIRKLKHDTRELLDRVALGESLEIRRHNKAIAVLKPLESRGAVRPDFRARLNAIYGDKVLSETATSTADRVR